MNKELSEHEIKKIRELCFTNPLKCCAIAQEIVDTCGVVSCATFAQVKGRGKRAVQYQSEKLVGIKIEDRKFIAINQ